MKLLTMILSISMVALGATQSRAEGFLEATGKYAQKYGIPCVAGMAAGYVIDHDKGVKIGAIGCVIVFTYGEFGRGSSRTITTDDVDIIQGMISKDVRKSSDSIQEESNQKFDKLNLRITDESTANRQNVRNSVTDLGVYLEKDLSEKVDRRMENPKLLEAVDTKINARVKEEVQEEYRSHEREIVEKTTEKVIKRVIAEPIVDDSPKRPVQPNQ